MPWFLEERERVNHKERAREEGELRGREREERGQTKAASSFLVRPLFFFPLFFFAREAPCGVLRDNCCRRIDKTRRFQGVQLDNVHNAGGKRGSRATFLVALFSLHAVAPSQSLGDRLFELLSLSVSPPPRAHSGPALVLEPDPHRVMEISQQLVVEIQGLRRRGLHD